MEKKKKKYTHKKPYNNAFLKYTGTAFQMLATILAGLFLGRFLDAQTGVEKPIFTAICSLMFTIVAIYVVIKDFVRKK